MIMKTKEEEYKDETQVVITIKHGVVINVESNRDLSYQIVDLDIEESEQVSDIYEPDEINSGYIFKD